LSVLKKCVESVFDKTDYDNYEIIIVDNGSDDLNTLDYLNKLEERPEVTILTDPRPFNYSELNNAAVARCDGEIICLLNNDTEIISTDWLREMVSHAIRPGVGAVGAKLLYPDQTVQHAGVVLGVGGIAGHIFSGIHRDDPGYFGRASIISNYSAVTAACLVIRKDTFEKVGGLNEKQLAVAFNDVDLCLKVRDLGLRNVWTPYAELYHHESKSRGRDDTPITTKRFQGEVAYMRSTWADELDNDPNYNPNFTLTLPAFQLGKPRVQ